MSMPRKGRKNINFKMLTDLRSLSARKLFSDILQASMNLTGLLNKLKKTEIKKKNFNGTGV
jgi:hypothetical protein